MTALFAEPTSTDMLTIKPKGIEPDMIFLSGWKSPEHDFIWAIGPVNIINIPLGSVSEFRGKNIKFAVELNVPITPSNPDGSRLTFMLGGTVLLDQTVKERTRIIFHAPATTTAPRLNILHITNHNPAYIEGMALGFQLYAIEMEELPILREDDVFTFGRGSLHTAILGSGWKDPEEDFCWSAGKESMLTLLLEAEAYLQEEPDVVRVAEIILSVSFHNCLDLERRHWHILDVVTNHLLLNRHTHSGVDGLVTIPAYVPLRSDAAVDLWLIDHCATAPALLGNDPNDHTVLGFQLFSLELARIHTIPCAEMPTIASLFEPCSPLAIGVRSGGNDG